MTVSAACSSYLTHPLRGHLWHIRLAQDLASSLSLGLSLTLCPISTQQPLVPNSLQFPLSWPLLAAMTKLAKQPSIPSISTSPCCCAPFYLQATVSFAKRTAAAKKAKNLLNKSPTTSCSLDPLPTLLLKNVSDTLMPFMTRLVNSSIASSVVPRCLKHANVIPVLKKANLDHNNMNSYRPI